LLQQYYPDFEVWVMDDDSQDNTLPILNGLAASNPCLHVLRSDPLPTGWLGKNWACWQLVQHVPERFPLLLFVDADTWYAPDALREAVAMMEAGQYNLLSILPRQVTESLAEQLTVPILSWSLLSHFPLWLRRRVRWRGLAAAVGQFMLWRREAYQAVGGHAAVRGEIIEDIALARRAARVGLRAALLPGYVGGCLRQALEQRGYRLRAMARRPEFLRPKVAPTTEVVSGDVLDIESLRRALAGVQSAYYLVHTMGAPGDFEERDRMGAHNFARAAKETGVQRIIYLGGLGDEKEKLSPHLRSRHEVGAILRETGIPVLEFRASIVIGSGSLSFEMVRALCERLPVMITPKWVSAKAQPIAIVDLIAYLVAGLHLPTEQCGIYEIGGADQVSYADIMRIYARVRGLHLYMIPVPVITPYLSSLWLGLVTPLYARVGRRLIESIVHATVVRDDRARHVFDIEPMGVEEAIRRTLANEEAA